MGSCSGGMGEQMGEFCCTEIGFVTHTILVTCLLTSAAWTGAGGMTLGGFKGAQGLKNNSKTWLGFSGL
jgi:hypothetical protein